MNNMVEPFLRSARTGNNLLLIDQTIAGVSGPGSPESFLTQNHDTGVLPLYFPGDDHAFEGIREIAEKGNAKFAEHTLKNVDSFCLWEKTINDAAKKKLYCPQLNDTVIEAISRGN